METNEERLNKYRVDEDIVFGKKWFIQHQNRLIKLLNQKSTRRWFRWVLHIRSFDCPLNTDINEITPNSFSYGEKLIFENSGSYIDNSEKLQYKIGNLVKQRTTDFRTHDKFSKRLYFAFKPFWYTLHAFDWAMMDRIEAMSKLSFGFSTLTQYPGSIGANSPVDGYVAQSVDNATWAATRDGAGNTVGYSGETGNNVISIGNGGTSGFVGIFRSIFCFDTSTIGSTMVVGAAVLSLYGNSKADGLSISMDADIYLATPASTTSMVAGDFTQIGTTSQTGAPITYASLSASAYNDFTFNATGRGNVSKTGISKFGCRNANRDVANSAPGYVGAYALSQFRANFSDSTGTTTDPKLVVTYLALVAISGNVALGGTGVSGAVVRLIRQDTDTELAKTTTDGSGNYTFSDLNVNINTGGLYHVIVEYTNGGTKYNAKSLWNIVPV